ncbi:hypothetical protein FHS30_000820 [Simiduia aestuariiviva]|uniref:Uncharacterized protein n=2 Tax=Simiduia aestuariiviva TaxID=1510459 RepID=A0A839UHY3_9GAMM|nr:hypothetical protein [Simiduia aestuariiviva]
MELHPSSKDEASSEIKGAGSRMPRLYNFQGVCSLRRGEYSAENNPLVKAPHTQDDVLATEWDRPYSREKEKLARLLGC